MVRIGLIDGELPPGRCRQHARPVGAVLDDTGVAAGVGVGLEEPLLPPPPQPVRRAEARLQVRPRVQDSSPDTVAGTPTNFQSKPPFNALSRRSETVRSSPGPISRTRSAKDTPGSVRDMAEAGCVALNEPNATTSNVAASAATMRMTSERPARRGRVLGGVLVFDMAASGDFD